MAWWRKLKNLNDCDLALTRDQLVRRSRILIIDDERPELITDLQGAGFSVDYWPDVAISQITVIERQRYDLILLDFGNVGKTFGSDEGLSLLRHIKRVSPSTVILTYTSRALPTAHADFYRLADATLAKDAGIQESTTKIEEALRLAHSPERVWAGFLAECNLSPGSVQDLSLQDLLVRTLQNPKKSRSFMAKVSEFVSNDEAQAVAIRILGKFAEGILRNHLGA